MYIFVLIKGILSPFLFWQVLFIYVGPIYKILAYAQSHDNFLMFSSGSLIFLIVLFTFMFFLNYFIWCEVWVIFLSLNFSSTILWKKTFLICFGPKINDLGPKINDHKTVGLFLCYFVTLFYLSICIQLPHYLNYHIFI